MTREASNRRAGRGTFGDAQASSEAIPEYDIRPRRGLSRADLREIWAFRELIYFLTWRDIKVRYKQTAIGVVWALVQPAAMMAVFTLIFGRLAQIRPSDGTAYPVFALTALLPWQFFTRSLVESTGSLVADQRLISRVYFPRIIVPAATSMAAFVDFLISGVLLALVMLYFGTVPTSAIVAAPIFVVMMLMTSLGIGFWLSALNIEFRDVAYTIPFLTQFWFFATPVVYSVEIIPEAWRGLYALNPMVGIVEGFRWSLLGSPVPSAPILAVSSISAAVLFLSGLLWFRRRERAFADVVGSGGR